MEKAHAEKHTKATEEEATQLGKAAVDAEQKAQLDDDVDSILDEIDDVLETNAEDFVNNYVQKGGQ
ncbi:MAG TPA: ubiquitin-like protein Pup [Candidatus Microsaccharimonas sp.]|nr:ubiquitin-like protein Pup [Candidatus Microsaccharimonas sp.]